MADLKYHRKSSVSPVTSFVEWVRLKNYQYEVSSSLYMLTPAEKLVFSTLNFLQGLEYMLTTSRFNPLRLDLSSRHSRIPLPPGTHLHHLQSRVILYLW